MNLKQRRKEMGMTQTDVAKAVGVSLFAYQNWEREVTTPKPENMEKLCKVLNIKLEEIKE